MPIVILEEIGLGRNWFSRNNSINYRITAYKSYSRINRIFFGKLFDIIYDFVVELLKKVFRTLLKVIRKEKIFKIARISNFDINEEKKFMIKVYNIQCPCCGYFTILYDDEIIVDICEVCGWQYDITGQEYSNIAIGPNHVSLNEAKENYKIYRVSDKNFLDRNWLREPLFKELPENNKERKVD